VNREAVSLAVGKPHVIYEIRARKPGPDFLKYRSQLTEFGALLRHILASVRKDFRSVRRLHFFLACPAPIAIDCGRSLIEKADPEVLVYEYAQPNYALALTLNTRKANHD
jgi:SMODS-associated and fused to various effectors sensor domain